MLLPIYLEALARCAPERLVAEHVTSGLPRNVVAIGKCAGALLDGVAASMTVERAFVAIPEGYRLPRTRAEIAIGGHPEMTTASFEAGRRLLAFVDACDEVLFLVSGGGSACVEVPLAPHTADEVSAVNARLLNAGLPIGEMNRIRRQYSAIKGGRLGRRVRGRRVTFVYSDVSSGALADVASGPSIADASEAILIADNDTLTAAAAAVAARNGYKVRRWNGQLEGDVDDAAQMVADAAATLEPGQLLVAGGEPTTVKRGAGKGGRCSELAVRFALRAQDRDVQALFASSDGVDGSSGAAGILLRGIPPFDHAEAVAALEASNSFAVASRIGEAIMIAAAGNNLRDLFLLARG
jgi:glycerate 2-kinase